mmetsp:Transcript_8056/g.19448  ORF Transcript_8056/g.19448 Transcript_8056/m.19448 type:complete len:618 (-) Transcript_8056:506-2359(-)
MLLLPVLLKILLNPPVLAAGCGKLPKIPAFPPTDAPVLLSDTDSFLFFPLLPGPDKAPRNRDSPSASTPLDEALPKILFSGLGAKMPAFLEVASKMDLRLLPAPGSLISLEAVFSSTSFTGSAEPKMLAIFALWSRPSSTAASAPKIKDVRFIPPPFALDDVEEVIVVAAGGPVTPLGTPKIEAAADLASPAPGAVVALPKMDGGAAAPDALEPKMPPSAGAVAFPSPEVVVAAPKMPFGSEAFTASPAGAPNKPPDEAGGAPNRDPDDVPGAPKIEGAAAPVDVPAGAPKSDVPPAGLAPKMLAPAAAPVVLPKMDVVGAAGAAVEDVEAGASDPPLSPPSPSSSLNSAVSSISVTAYQMIFFVPSASVFSTGSSYCAHTFLYNCISLPLYFSKSGAKVLIFFGFFLRYTSRMLSQMYCAILLLGDDAAAEVAAASATFFVSLFIASSSSAVGFALSSAWSCCGPSVLFGLERPSSSISSVSSSGTAGSGLVISTEGATPKMLVDAGADSIAEADADATGATPKILAAAPRSSDCELPAFGPKMFVEEVAAVALAPKMLRALVATPAASPLLAPKMVDFGDLLPAAPEAAPKTLPFGDCEAAGTALPKMLCCDAGG